jgi:hypothetical protein
MIRQQLFIHQDIVQRHEDISKKGNEKALFNLAVEQIKTHEKKIEQMQELYDRQKELAQEAIEELKRRRVGTEMTIGALQEIVQRR